MAARPQPPRGPVRRSAAVAAAVGGGGLRVTGTVLANLARSPERGADQLERRHREVAAELAALLGSMRGGAMKLGQVLSFVDPGLVPPPYRAIYEEQLAALRAAAPALEWGPVREVLERELGAPPEEVFAEIDTEAAAAASVGQVHRAVLRDGRRVAVKVQYPGVVEALTADVRAAGVLLPLARAMAPGLDPGPVAAELRERLLEEVDYELEAQSQRAFARVYRGHPFIHVPAPVTELCRERVLVTEWVDGLPFERIRLLPRPERDRVGEIVDRFYWGSLHRLRRVNADAHPGNYLLLEDGRVAFLDYGSTRAFTREQVDAQTAMMRAACDRDAHGLLRAMERLGYVRGSDAPDPGRLLAYTRWMAPHLVEDREVTMRPRALAERLARLSDPRSEEFRLARRQNMPGEYLMLHRLDVSVQAVLAQLEATGNWHRIAREWWYGEEPSTELGRADAAFFA